MQDSKIKSYASRALSDVDLEKCLPLYGEQNVSIFTHMETDSQL